VVVVGAGFAGLYMLYRLRAFGFSAIAIEAAEDVGGTWYWNRYPGARCDVPSVDYSYSFDPELDEEWGWTEKFATQPEILAYINHVAEKHDLRRDIRFSTRVEAATWDEGANLWRVRTDSGDEIVCRYYVMATGCLSVPKAPEVEGTAEFRGDVYFTSSWPREGVDFAGKRVGVIGTGSSGIQAIPLIAREAEALVVFQRTPNFSVPARNGAVPDYLRLQLETRRDEYREEARWSRNGSPRPLPTLRVFDVDEGERFRRFEAGWHGGELSSITASFTDLMVDPDANDAVSEFLRDKIRSIVDDPEIAEALCPTDYPFGTKRPCLDTDYYATYNRPNVRLVDLRKTPIDRISERGIETQDESIDLDVIVFATGFDAMTGALLSIDLAGRGGVRLADKWAAGPVTYLGLATAGFPNLFMITGPGSPSVLSNMLVSIEHHVEWIVDCLDHLRSNGFDVVEATPTAEESWGQHVNDCADLTLFPRAASWYMGANVPGKPRVILPYVGGVGPYRKACVEVVDRGYLGFVLSGGGRVHHNDGIVRRLQPDVAALLEAREALNLPDVAGAPVEVVRAHTAALAAGRPPGPEVGELVDGTLPGPAGDLVYRLFRPESDGPHGVVVYFHGGGWVVGSHDSDDPFCRDLCARSDALVVSVGYRLAPEAPFPAAVEDGLAAVDWIADHARELGGIPGALAVCGWSAGGNIAAVVCRLARDAGRPAISGQVLLNPVTDADMTRVGYVENGTGFILTADLMRSFWDHYAPVEDRADPRASPLRATDLGGLPPALVVTCEFDPLRDEGAAYARALSAAGVAARHVDCRGQIHTSVIAVDVIRSAAAVRAEVASELRGFLSGVPTAGLLTSG